MHRYLRQDGPAILKRAVGYMLRYYKIPFLLVVACIVVSAVCTVVGATFPQTLVDDYIAPMLANGSRDFSGLLQDIIQLACVMGAGVIASFTYNRIMVNVSQGTMQKLRDDLFRKMESLPIKYFDTHAHGDIMSVYTNDVDTLRQLLSQSIPQIINSMISMAATLVTMLILSPALSVISLLTAACMLMVTSNFSKLSGRYYIRQQQDLGAVDGFIEEMLDGQKVVKVFCHEEAAKADFRQVNDRLCESANMANRYSNLLMPINANIGWVSYVLVAIVGAVLAINGMAGVSLGTVVTFVGATGAGKTTITNLINRFYDIADGKIRYDGININKIKKPDLRRSLGIVLQDTHLFTGTVMENIRYGNLEASDEDCIAAARLANADGFIRRCSSWTRRLLPSIPGRRSWYRTAWTP